MSISYNFRARTQTEGHPGIRKPHHISSKGNYGTGYTECDCIPAGGA